MTQAARLVEETLVEHHVACSWLSLAQRNLLGDVTVGISLVLRLVEAGLLTAPGSLVLLAKESADLIPLLLLLLASLVHLHVLMRSFLTGKWKATFFGIFILVSDLGVKF